MKWGDFLIWAGQTTQGVGGALGNGGSVQDWLNFGGNALGNLGNQLGTSNPIGGAPIYIPIGGGQSLQTNTNTIMYIGLGLLALMILKK